MLRRRGRAQQHDAGGYDNKVAVKHVWTYWGADPGQLRPALAAHYRLGKSRDGSNPIRAFVWASARGDSLGGDPFGVFGCDSRAEPLAHLSLAKVGAAARHWCRALCPASGGNLPRSSCKLTDALPRLNRRNYLSDLRSSHVSAQGATSRIVLFHLVPWRVIVTLAIRHCPSSCDNSNSMSVNC